MKIYGITGGIGTGKSTVSRMLKEAFHYPVIDADELAKNAAREPEVLEQIAKTFGSQYVNNGELDRRAMAKRVFENEGERKKLNAIVHPAVKDKFLREKKCWEEKGADMIFYDCPLLIEENLQSDVDAVILVFAGEQLQLARVMERNGLSEEEARARIGAQLVLTEKIKYADYVLYNDGTMADLKRAVAYLVKELGEES